jgi:hypothetical protein
MRNGLSKRGFPACALHVGVDPLPVFRKLRKGGNALLAHLKIIGDANLGIDVLL